jgi:hypothetical protein
MQAHALKLRIIFGDLLVNCAFGVRVNRSLAATVMTEATGHSDHTSYS